MSKAIEHLLDKYFEGLSTLREEQELRTYFRQENIPEHLQKYTALFTHTDLRDNSFMHDLPYTRHSLTGKSRIPKGTRAYRPSEKPQKGLRVVLWTLAGAVACLAIVAGLHLQGNGRNPCAKPGNSYAMIDGKCYTDKVLLEHFMNRSRKIMSQDLSDNPVTEQLRALDLFGNQEQ